MKAQLTDVSVRALKAPAHGQATIWDKNKHLNPRWFDMLAPLLKQSVALQPVYLCPELPQAVRELSTVTHREKLRRRGSLPRLL